jgi:hypothetical protein
MKRVLTILTIPFLLLAVALIDGTTRESLTGSDRGGFTEIFVESSADVAAGTRSGESVVVRVISHEQATTEVTWFFSIDGREVRTGTLDMQPGGDEKVSLEMPPVNGSVWAEFKLLGKSQTLRWRVKEK